MFESTIILIRLWSWTDPEPGPHWLERLHGSYINDWCFPKVCTLLSPKTNWLINHTFEWVSIGYDNISGVLTPNRRLSWAMPKDLIVDFCRSLKILLETKARSTEYVSQRTKSRPAYRRTQWNTFFIWLLRTNIC